MTVRIIIGFFGVLAIAVGLGYILLCAVLSGYSGVGGSTMGTFWHFLILPNALTFMGNVVVLCGLGAIVWAVWPRRDVEEDA